MVSHGALHGVKCSSAQGSDSDAGADDGELFLERSESESFVFDDGRLKSAAYDATEGFGLRVVAGETAGYAHANEISAAALRRAADSAALAIPGDSADLALVMVDAMTNPGWREEAIGVKLNARGWLEEIRLCYSKTFRPARCTPSRWGAKDAAPAKIWRGL